MAPIEAVRDPDPEQHPGLDGMTAAETALAERKAAQGITTLGNEKYPQANLLGALGWVLHRRIEPGITFDAYMGSRRIADITKELGLSDDEDDDDAEDQEAAGKEDDETTSPA